VKSVNLQHAKTHLLRLIDEALAGEEVVIARAGTALVRLTPVEPAKAPRQLGRDRGKIVVHDDFDEPMPEIEELFYGSPDPA
jgi:prevent-host-death family protein